MSIEKVVYRAHASATGGRDGRAVSDDGVLDIKLGVPKEMGGMGGGTNPEQLFAAGYSACFLGALKAVAAQEKLRSLLTRKLKARWVSGQSRAVTVSKFSLISLCRALNAATQKRWWPKHIRFVRTPMPPVATSM